MPNGSPAQGTAWTMTPSLRVWSSALARSRGEEFSRDARGRRELWEAAGVATDQVSSTALACGLMPLEDDWPARMLRERSLARAGIYLMMRDGPAD